MKKEQLKKVIREAIDKLANKEEAGLYVYLVMENRGGAGTDWSSEDGQSDDRELPIRGIFSSYKAAVRALKETGNFPHKDNIKKVKMNVLVYDFEDLLQ